MFSFRLLAAIACGSLVMLPAHTAVETHNIPPHLLECYQNESLYHRENRLPASMPVAISLLRQVEESPGFTMDARSFALSLLHTFRVDGIERLPGVVASEYAIPFGLTGQQYNRYRILMDNLIPRSSFLFPNETLSVVEKCSLHFMLSNSISAEVRGDESKSCSAAGFSSFRAPSAPLRRQRRDLTAALDLSDDEDEDDLNLNDDEEQHLDAATATAADDSHDFGTEAVEAVGGGSTAPAAAAAPAPAAPAPAPAPPAPVNPEAEMVPQTAAGVASAGAGDKKGNLVWGEDGPGPKSRGQLQAAPSARTELPASDCPVENGVVHTRWGSVQLGAVLAGVATGYETQVVSIKDIRSGSRDLTGVAESQGIDNRYAATLAGDLAEVALWRGPKNTVKVGASGNWNSSQTHKWYFIKEANEMTDTEIRGGLDGLIVARNVQSWTNKASALRLSTILERYYSYKGVFEEDYRACDRQNHYKDVAPTSTLQDQAASFAFVLYDSTPSMPTITGSGFPAYAKEAADALDKTVRESVQMETNCKTSLRYPEDTQPEPKLNLIFVVDCRWNHDEITPALQALAENLILHPTTNKLTVLGAASHEVLFNTSDRTHSFSMKMKENSTQYRQCTPSMNLNDLLDNYLRIYFTNQLQNEKDRNKADVQSNVVVLMPYGSYDISAAELREVEIRRNEYKKSFPDVKFLFFTPQKKESFKILVENHDTDIIEFSYIMGNPIDTLGLENRLKTVPRRITNPGCGPEWVQKKNVAVSIFDNIPYQQIAYYRIHPKYLFGIGSETIKIREQNKGKLRVCFSRTNETPNDDDSSEDSNESNNECTSVSGSEVEIKLNNPCSGSSSYETCDPLYISIEAEDTRLNCAEKADCKDVDDVTVEITATRLTCGTSAVRSSITLAVALFVISKFFFSS